MVRGKGRPVAAEDDSPARSGFILMQQTAAGRPSSPRSHFPQAEEPSGSNIVTPRRGEAKKRFWETDNAEGTDGEEVAVLVHRPTEQVPDHEAAEYDADDVALARDGRRAGLLWRAVASCCQDVSHMIDEDRHISDHLREEVRSWWKSKTVRTSILGAVLMFLLALIVTLRIGTAHDGLRGAPRNPTEGLISAASLCVDTQDLFNPATRMCKMENRIAFGAMALQNWAHCDLNSQGARLLQSNMDQSGAFWYSYRQRDAVRAFYRSCVTNCATPLDTFNPATGLCEVSEPLARAWLVGCRDLVAMGGHDSCSVASGQGATCEPTSPRSAAALQQLMQHVFVPQPQDSRVPSLASGFEGAGGVRRRRGGVGGGLGYRGAKSISVRATDVGSRGHRQTADAGGEDGAYLYYFPEEGEKVKMFLGNCHELCAAGDSVLTVTPTSACQVRNVDALAQLNDNGDLLRSCKGDVPRWLAKEAGGPSGTGRGVWSYASAHRALVQVFYDSCGDHARDLP